MSNLIAITFDDQKTAFDLRAKLVELQTEYLIEMDDVVVVTRDDEGKVKLHQAVNLTAAGAVGGSFWGMLIGLLFLNPLLGAAVGAGSGALSGWMSDIGINDQFMKDAAEALQPNTAGLFLLIRKMTTDKVLADLKGVGGTLMQTSFDETKEAQLRAALSAAAETEAPQA